MQIIEYQQRGPFVGHRLNQRGESLKEREAL
jgi:hypothetical protein